MCDKVFEENYSKYYNLLYLNKDYKKEADYVKKLMKRYNPRARKILELGCGTGKHAYYLSKKFKIVGIDQSNTMIQMALKNKNDNMNFFTSSISNLDIKGKFDVVISLFHVMSYQTSNDEIVSAFKTAAKYLKKGGIFIFDFWYGPAVLHDKPVVRIKKIKNKEVEIIRLATPEMIENNNVVNVNFEIVVLNKREKKITKFYETHKMRYFFLPEIDYLFKTNQLVSINYFEWLEQTSKPSTETWYAVAIAKKV